MVKYETRNLGPREAARHFPSCRQSTCIANVKHAEAGEGAQPVRTKTLIITRDRDLQSDVTSITANSSLCMYHTQGILEHRGTISNTYTASSLNAAIVPCPEVQINRHSFLSRPQWSRGVKHELTSAVPHEVWMFAFILCTYRPCGELILFPISRTNCVYD
jgi:hypothetical protein